MACLPATARQAVGVRAPPADEMITMVFSEAAELTGSVDGEGFSPEECTT